MIACRLVMHVPVPKLLSRHPCYRNQSRRGWCASTLNTQHVHTRILHTPTPVQPAAAQWLSTCVRVSVMYLGVCLLVSFSEWLAALAWSSRGCWDRYGASSNRPPYLFPHRRFPYLYLLSLPLSPPQGWHSPFIHPLTLTALFINAVSLFHNIYPCIVL